MPVMSRWYDISVRISLVSATKPDSLEARRSESVFARFAGRSFASISDAARLTPYFFASVKEGRVDIAKY
jgi:hypothetical protein